MTVVSRAIEGGAHNLVRMAAVVCDAAVVLGTPVDTGRARANWLASIGAPKTDPVLEFDRGGQKTIAAAQTVIADYDGEGEGIFLANNVAYIMPLENGHSDQAPFGMAKHAVAAAEAAVKKGKILEG